MTEVVRPKVARMRYRVSKSHPYLIFHMVRFNKNNFFKEKNPTLVNPQVKDIELRDYIPSLPTAPDQGDKVSSSKYNIIANIVHDGKHEDGYFRVFVKRKSQQLWYEM